MTDASPLEEGSVLTVQDLQRVLRISKSLAYQLVASGELPSIRIGRGRRSVRVMREDLEAYVARLRAEADPRAPALDLDATLRRVRRPRRA